MKPKILIPIVLVVLVVGGGLLAATMGGFFNDDPEEVSLGNTTAAPEGDGDLEFAGTWEVDNESGSLDADPPTSSFAGYRIQEEFAGIGANTAVGRTQNVDGTMVIDGNEITEVDIAVDMTTLRSDRDMRDNALRDRGIETDTHPEATFVLSEPIAIAEEPEEGEEIAADATGDFTLHGVTKEITIPLQARWSGDTITVVSSFDVALADHDIERPTTQRVVSIADQGTVEMQLLFKQAA